MAVRGITLFVFGGVSAIEGEAERPLDEFLIAVVGPLTSGAIAGLAWLASGAVNPTTGLPHAILAYLAAANGILAAFNLVPGYPLDGGRILRALVWGVSGNLRTSTKVASYVGQAVAYGLIALGVLRMFGGDFLGGVWTAFIGWFLSGAAESSRRQLAVQAGFRGVRVRDLMTPEPDAVPPTMRLDAFVREEVVRRGHPAAPVLDGDRLVGVVSIADAQKVEGDAWPATPLSAVMTTEDLAVVGPDDPVERGLKLMAQRDLDQVLVVERGRLVGLLTRAGLVRFVALRERFGLEARPPGAGGTPAPEIGRAA
jgi:CBS domain-containing protein